MKLAVMVATLLFLADARAAGLGITEAWRAAVRHDPAFEAAQAQREAGRTHVAQARALWLPTFSARGSLGLGDQEIRSGGAAFSGPGFGSTNGVDFQTSVTGGTMRQWAFVAEQPLFDASRKATSTEQRNVAATAEAQFDQARQDLVLRTVRAYLAVINSRIQLDALRQLHAAAQRARATAQARYDSGDLAITDMREAQASADAIGVQQLDAQAAVALSEAALTDLTGLDAVQLKVLPDTQPVELPKTDALEIWTQRALASSPQLSIQRLALETAAVQVDRYGLLESPRVSLVAQLGRDSLRGSGDFGTAAVASRQAGIALQASIPLFTGWLRSAQRHEAKQLQRKAGADLEVADQQVRQQTRVTWQALTTAAAQVRALQRLRDSAGQRLEATRLGVEVGERTALDLLDAQAQFLWSGSEFHRAQTDWLLADLQLHAIAGLLTETDLERVDRYLREPDAGNR